MIIKMKKLSAWKRTEEVVILPVFKQGKGLVAHEMWETITQELPWVPAYVARHGFTGAFKESLVIPCGLTTGALMTLVVVGLGERNVFTTDRMRLAMATARKRVKEAKALSVACLPPEKLSAEDGSATDLWQAAFEGWLLAGYTFHTYKGKREPSLVTEEKGIEQATWYVTLGQLTQAEKGYEVAQITAAATATARDLVNTPSMDMTPAHMLSAAQAVAKGRVSLKTLDVEAMKELGMQAALAVGMGSEHKPVGAHFTYKPSGKIKKRIVLVGKAVTFDSGGLSLKPADGMMTMKIDMAGAATVIGVFQALASLSVNVEVHGVFLAVENMPSGGAYRPGDVVKAMNGKTIEVLNTDAEGRVTLADALSYTTTLEPDVVIDLATLTGACVVALGEEVAGIMGNDKRLIEKLTREGEATGEPLWELPLFPGYEDHVKSKIADVKNIGARGQAGTISAALFLQHFIGKYAWAHLDIAGPSYAEKESRSDTPYGGTGFGVRLLLRYLQSF